jgi:hypothetical protein
VSPQGTIQLNSSLPSPSYCPIFYNEVDSTHLCSGTTVASLNIRGGTTLHEVTMALDLTDEINHGCSDAQSLASTDPANAMINADSYNVGI